MVRLFNTLTRTKEDFETLEPGVVRMYVCGVTVYDDAHVGHAMSAIVFDVIRRYLEYRGYRVRYVMNYTDVDDKIIRRAAELGADPLRLAQHHIDEYERELSELNVLPATANPRATQTMTEIQSMVQGLIDRGHAYRARNGDVYFRVTRVADYGKLSGRRLEELQAGARVEIGEEKENPADFALWKGAKPGEPTWDSPWGKGRPGWHIECSAMNLKEFGNQIDIHGGGNDLVFPHHENEIAQSEAFTGQRFARYWIHNGMLQLRGEKMSKSLGNTVSIREFLMNRDADALRMLVLSGSYRAPLIFSEGSLDQAERALDRLRSALRPDAASEEGVPAGVAAELTSQAGATREAFIAAMDDDFNTPVALARIHELVKAINTARDEGATSKQLEPAHAVLRELTSVLGLRLAERRGTGDADKLVELLLRVRSEARRQKLWSFGDLIRDGLHDLGVQLEDGKEGTSWHWR